MRAVSTFEEHSQLNVKQCHQVKGYLKYLYIYSLKECLILIDKLRYNLYLSLSKGGQH